jgi:hypothetical protein
MWPHLKIINTFSQRANRFYLLTMQASVRKRNFLPSATAYVSGVTLHRRLSLHPSRKSLQTGVKRCAKKVSNCLLEQRLASSQQGLDWINGVVNEVVLRPSRGSRVWQRPNGSLSATGVFGRPSSPTPLFMKKIVCYEGSDLVCIEAGRFEAERARSRLWLYIKL